jgi:hypothetical protein
MSSAASRAWYWAIGVNWASPVTSPAAHGDPGLRPLDPSLLELELLDVRNSPGGEQDAADPQLALGAAVAWCKRCNHL